MKSTRRKTSADVNAGKFFKEVVKASAPDSISPEVLSTTIAVPDVRSNVREKGLLIRSLRQDHDIPFKSQYSTYYMNQSFKYRITNLKHLIFVPKMFIKSNVSLFSLRSAVYLFNCCILDICH